MKNNQFWFWGFIVLATLLISAVITLGMKTYHFHNVNTESSSERTYNDGQKVPKGKGGTRTKFNFTEQQKQFFKQERQQHQQKIHTIKDKKKLNQNNLFKEIAKTNPSNDSIEIYKKAILKSNEEVIDETISYYGILKTRLNQEQMQMVNKHVSRRFKKK